MVLGRKTKRHPGGTTVTTTTTTTHHPPEENGRGAHAVRTKPTLKQRLMGGRRTRATGATGATGATTAAPTRRRRVGARRTPATAATTTPRRKTSVGDKVSGAMLKLKGTLTRRPGQKAAGTRRMHGTDGRGAHQYY